MRPFAISAVAVLLAAGCGGDDRPAATSATTARPARPVDTPCRDIRTMAQARRLAAKLDYLLIAPEDHSRREVVGTFANSLHATCRQPSLPGVSDPLDYRPVKPVIAELQREFDEDELSGG